MARPLSGEVPADQAVVRLNPGVPRMVHYNVPDGVLPVPTALAGGEQCSRHRVHVAVLHNHAQAGLAYEEVVREPRFADHRQPGSKVVVQLAALVVVHEGPGGDQHAEVRVSQVIPGRGVRDDAEVGHDARVERPRVSGPEHIQAGRAPLPQFPEPPAPRPEYLDWGQAGLSWRHVAAYAGAGLTPAATR